MSPIWVTFAVALAASLLLTPVARWLALRWHVVDSPDGGRKRQKAPVPLLGGVALYCAMLLGLLMARLVSPDPDGQLAELSTALVAAAGFVCLLGCVDDICDLKPRVKLLLQIGSVLPVVVSGYYVDRVVAFGIPLELGLLGIPITVLWLVGCINAINLLDGMDGLAGVVGLSTTVMMAVLAAHTGHPHVALIATVLAGALAGFLIYNLPPASIYLGDSGSMIIGLAVGILSIQAALKTSTTLTLTAPAVALTVPMLDTVLAIVRRRLSGQRFDSADRGHIHHSLLDRGLTNWQALCIIGALCLTTGAAATAATLLSNDAIGWLIVLVILVVLVRTRAFGHHELSLFKLSIAAVLTRVVHRLSESARPGFTRGKSKAAEIAFEPAWSALQEELRQWKVHQLELDIERPLRPANRRVWTDPAHSDNGGDWTLEMRFAGPGGERCQLRVSALDPHDSEPWYLLRIARLIKNFGQHWAVRTEQISTSAELAQPLRIPTQAEPLIKAA